MVYLGFIWVLMLYDVGVWRSEGFPCKQPRAHLVGLYCGELWFYWVYCGYTLYGLLSFYAVRFEVLGVWSLKV